MLRTNIVMPQSPYLDLVRDSTVAVTGAGLYGNISMGKAGDLDYQFLAGKVNPDKVNGTHTVIKADNPDRSKDDWYYGAAKLTFNF